MTRPVLDLPKIRRNWERADTALLEAPPERRAEVRAPLDPYREGARLLERLRREVADEFPKQRDVLAPFILRAETIFTNLCRETAAEPVAALREEFMAALHDIEDLCEALLGLGR